MVERQWLSALAPCQKPSDYESCDALASWLKGHPASPHTAKGQAILRGSGPTLDELAWKTTGGPERCASPRLTDACDNIKVYLSRHPQGKHAVEAQAALDKGGPVIAQAVAQQQAEAERLKQLEEPLRISKAYVYEQLKSPSTAQWVDAILVESCADGSVIKRTLDVQNGYGAMIRAQWFVFINSNTRRVIGCEMGDRRNNTCDFETYGYSGITRCQYMQNLTKEGCGLIGCEHY